MKDTEYFDDLNNRLRKVIQETCNKIGCNNCDLKWNEGEYEKCSATELQGKIYDEQFKHFKQQR